MRVLVTGAGGFLGYAIARSLVERGDTVRSIARGAYPKLDELGVEAQRGDISSLDDVMRAMDGCDAVMHVAAKAGVWGSRASYMHTNVDGTRHVISACRAHGVTRLVYTSTPSVVHPGENVEGIDESTPYAENYLTAYPETKAIAEREVLAAANDGLLTVALRPHLIWGPGDNHLVPRILDRRRSGRLAFVGDGSNLIDATYIDNAAHAHLLALDALKPGAACVGRAYFIAQGAPIATADLINGICDAAGLPPVEKRVSPRVAFWVGAMLEGVYRLVGAKNEPPMTRFVAKQLATAHWYDLSAAERDLGYRAQISTEQGLERLREALASGAG